MANLNACNQPLLRVTAPGHSATKINVRDDGGFRRKRAYRPLHPARATRLRGNATLSHGHNWCTVFLKRWPPGNMHVVVAALDFRQCRHSLGKRNETIVFG